MRSHWHKESSLRGEDNEAGADREKERGDQVFSALIADSERLLTQYARNYFDRDDSLVTDGVQELVVALYQELRNLSGSVHAVLWETRYGLCLWSLAYTLFTRKIQKQYGKGRQDPDPDAPDKERPYIEQKQSDFLTDDSDFDPIGSAPDIESADTIPRLLQSAELRALLAAIPNVAQREALWLSCLGWKQERIAERLGCSVKTVYNWIAKATAFAAAWAQKRYQTHGEFSDWLGS